MHFSVPSSKSSKVFKVPDTKIFLFSILLLLKFLLVLHILLFQIFNYGRGPMSGDQFNNVDSKVLVKVKILLIIYL